MTEQEIIDFCMALLAAGFMPSVEEGPLGKWIEATRQGSSIDVLAPDRFVAKKLERGVPSTEMEAATLQQALDYAATIDTIDYENAGFLAAELAESLNERRWGDLDFRYIEKLPNGVGYRLVNERRTWPGDNGVDILDFGNDGEQLIQSSYLGD